jgi:sugar lactone lactonase YvrE
MRRILIGVSVLLLPTIVVLTVFLIATKKIPTNREAVGNVGSLAGSGSPVFADGKVASSGFCDPFGIAVDPKGYVIVSDGGDANRIRRISPSGIVETLAGSSEGFADGDSAGAKFDTPSGIDVGRSGDIFVADTSNNRIRKVSDGQVSTLAGSGAAGFQDGPAAEAQFDGPLDVAVDSSGSVLVADTYNDRIRKISSDGSVTTLAGSDKKGLVDGETTTARFNTPSGIAVDDRGNVFVADTGNSAIRRIGLQGQVATIAARDSEVVGGRMRLRHPVGIAVTHDGFLFVSCDDGILRITPDGVLEPYAGGTTGFSEGIGPVARFSNPAGLGVDREGDVFVADSQNHLIRMIVPAGRGSEAAANAEAIFVQPLGDKPVVDATKIRPLISLSELSKGGAFPWPLAPQDKWHEIAGVVGEARGAPGGVALDHLHSGLDVRGQMGDAALAVYDEKVSAPIPNWDFDSQNEGISVGLVSYIHVRVGRDAQDQLVTSPKFKASYDDAGKLVGVCVRRGTRFAVGDFVGSLNSMYHVHLNLGPWNAQANPIGLPFPGLKDNVPPVVEPNGIEVVGMDGKRLTDKREGRVVVSGDVQIWVTAFDRVDGNGASRKLGLYQIGYQIVNADGSAVKGYEQPFMNIEFERLPPDDPSVAVVYAPGSGVSAYGTPTRFTYIVTNFVRDGVSRRGLLRTSQLEPGNYLIRIDALDFAGNRAIGPETELPITIVR